MAQQVHDFRADVGGVKWDGCASVHRHTGITKRDHFMEITITEDGEIYHIFRTFTEFDALPSNFGRIGQSGSSGPIAYMLP